MSLFSFIKEAHLFLSLSLSLYLSGLLSRHTVFLVGTFLPFLLSSFLSFRLGPFCPTGFFSTTVFSLFFPEILLFFFSFFLVVVPSDWLGPIFLPKKKKKWTLFLKKRLLFF